MYIPCEVKDVMFSTRQSMEKVIQDWIDLTGELKLKGGYFSRPDTVQAYETELTRKREKLDGMIIMCQVLDIDTEYYEWLDRQNKKEGAA